MTDVSKHEAAAQALRDAEHGRSPIAPLRDVVAPTDEAGAYAIQSINVKHRLAAGARVVGRKIGLTSLAVQRQLGVDQPDYGVLFDDMAVGADNLLQSGRLIQPKIEAEIAIVLRSDLTSRSTSAADVAAATDYAVAALEIVDSRIADWKIAFADTVADNGSSAFFVLGVERRRIEEFDAWLRDDAAAQRQPCLSRQWRRVPGQSAGGGGLARTHARTARRCAAQRRHRPDRRTRPMVPIKAGDKVQASVSGLGSVSCEVA